MTPTHIGQFLQRLNSRVFREGPARTDGQLLVSFLDQRNEGALAALIGRHGSMVWNVCRRMLANRQDAEDAFQATFLVLVQKARTLANKEMVGNWLHGVAYKTAVRMRALAARRAVREGNQNPFLEPTQKQPQEQNDHLDDALSGLSSKYRDVIVLCYLEGKTRKEIAKMLNIPEGTVASRLATGRQMLAKRLRKRDPERVELMEAILVGKASFVNVPAQVLSSTTNAAQLLAAGTELANVTSPIITQLIKEVTQTMITTKIKSLLTLTLLIGLAGGSTFAGFGFHSGPRDPLQSEAINSQETPPTNKAVEQPKNPLASPAKEETSPRKFAVEELVVPSKIVSLLEEKLKLLQNQVDRTERLRQNKTASESEVINARIMVYRAELELREEMGKDPIPVLEKILLLLKEEENKAKQQSATNPGIFSVGSVEGVTLARLQAEIALEREKAKQRKRALDK